MLADHALEARTIGLALLDHGAHTAVAELPEDTWDLPAHRSIARVLRALSEERRAADVSLVASLLRDSRVLQAVGGLAYLAQITDDAGLASTHEGACRHLADLAARRRLAAAMTKALADLERTSAGDVSAELWTRLAELETGDRAAVVRAPQAVEASLRWLESLGDKQAKHIQPRYPSLQRLLLPWSPGELVVIGARPSTGKTAFALDLLQHVAGDGMGAMFASLETNLERLTARMLASSGGTSLEKMRRGEVDGAGWQQVLAGASELCKLNLGVLDVHDLRVSELRVEARAYKRRHGLEVLAIDYLQLMRGDRGARYQTRQEEIAAISRSLKGLAKELGVVVVALSQLSRESDKADRPPVLSDLRDSGQIEQDADCVLLMHRVDGGVSVIVEKQKDGGLGEVELRFEGHTMTFSEPSDHAAYEASPRLAPPTRVIQPHYQEPSYYEAEADEWTP